MNEYEWKINSETNICIEIFYNSENNKYTDTIVDN